MSTACGLRERDLASTASVIVPSNILTPPVKETEQSHHIKVSSCCSPMPELKAIPTEQTELLAWAETCPAHRVPCLLVSNRSYLKQ